METRKCLRCKGDGYVVQFGVYIRQQRLGCWVCECKGTLTPPDNLQIAAYVVTTHGGNVRIRTEIRPHFKTCMSMVGKPGPWGKTPQTLEESRVLWRATALGRRCTYVFKTARVKLGITNVYQNAVVEGTLRDPYLPELDALVDEIVKTVGGNNEQ